MTLTYWTLVPACVDKLADENGHFRPKNDTSPMARAPVIGAFEHSRENANKAADARNVEEQESATLTRPDAEAIKREDLEPAIQSSASARTHHRETSFFDVLDQLAKRCNRRAQPIRMPQNTVERSKMIILQ
jgi:hypothetical protein